MDYNKYAFYMKNIIVLKSLNLPATPYTFNYFFIHGSPRLFFYQLKINIPPVGHSGSYFSTTYNPNGIYGSST